MEVVITLRPVGKQEQMEVIKFCFAKADCYWLMADTCVIDHK